MVTKSTRSTVQGPASNRLKSEANRRFVRGLMRACGGAILFSIPMLMTMEMWSLGFYMDPFRLALFVLLNIPLLVGLSYYAGFEATLHLLDDVVDAFIAYAVGFAVAGVVLLLLAIIELGMSADEIIGKVTIQAVPASIGAMLARSQFGGDQPEDEKRRSERYEGGLFLMAVGALYLSSSLASTEEIVLISYKMTPGHGIALMVFSLVVMQAFLSARTPKGKPSDLPETLPFWPTFIRFTIVGYALALLISLLILWIFGSIDGLAAGQIIEAVVVLGFPAALGAGAARLIF